MVINHLWWLLAVLGVSSCFLWFLVVLCGSWWFFVVLGNFLVVLSGSLWFLVVIIVSLVVLVSSL